MEISISNKFLHNSNSLLSPILQFKFTSNSNRYSSFPLPFNRKWSLKPKTPILYSISGSNYGGWEDLKPIEDAIDSSKFDKFQQFLVSVGIDDRKHVFMFILGFISALAISRVRVSSILVFPASVLVFAAGFSLGFLRRGGSTNETSTIVLKKDCKDEKLRHLVELFNEMGVKVTNLEKEMDGGDFESFCNVVKSISVDILQAKNLVEDSTNDIGTFVGSKGELVEDVQVEKNLNQRSSTRKREPGISYFDVFQYIGGLFRENTSVAKHNKVKDVKMMTSGASVERPEEVKVINSDSGSRISNNIVDSSPAETSSTQGLIQQVPDMSADGAEKAELVNGLINGNHPTRVSHMQTPSSKGSNESFIEGYLNEKDMFMPPDNLYDPLDLDIYRRSREIDMRSFTTESRQSLYPEECGLDASNKYHVHPHRRKKGENGSYKFDFVEEREISGDPLNLDNQRIACDLEEDSASSSSSSSSSLISEDLMFNKHLTEATDLLKEARGCLKGKADEGKAEVMLYKSAKLLSRAAAMKPMSLLAVGQLGNTFLLHGELKLRISRELRTLLLRNASSSRGKSRIALKGLDEPKINRDKIASNLGDVCEECEGLLVEAGRQYRMALSIDGSDVRALYNWGIALSFRAQLIADIGLEAASDADKVYLAAIDKFNAMMSRNKAYAPDALFRWGVALQQRSRLRPSNAKEKMKLLHQAKSLFEDALCMDSNNVQVGKALSSCISELNSRRF